MEISNPLPGPDFFVSGSDLIYLSPAGGRSIAGRLKIDPPRLVAINLIEGRDSGLGPSVKQNISDHIREIHQTDPWSRRELGASEKRKPRENEAGRLNGLQLLLS